MGKGFTRKGNNETVISVRQTVICVCGLRLVPVIFALDIEELIIHRQNNERSNINRNRRTYYSH